MISDRNFIIAYVILNQFLSISALAVDLHADKSFITSTSEIHFIYLWLKLAKKVVSEASEDVCF